MYNIKWAEETAWIVGIAASIYVFEIVSSTERVDDWQTYFVSIGGGLARIVAASLLNQIRKLQR